MKTFTISKNYKYYIIASLLIMIIGLVLGLTRGLNLGIELTGGTFLHFELNQTFGTNEIKELIKDYNLNESITTAGFNNTQVIIKTGESLTNTQRNEIFTLFKDKYNLTSIDYLSSEQFGPTIGEELQKNAIYSIMIATFAMLIYIIFRFKFVYGLSAILALIHDVLILVSIYSIFNIQINLSFIAAVLTIFGYSINDTIVVFDRVRENVLVMNKAPFNEIADTSIFQTFWRSINTSLTTLLGIVALYFLGVESIKSFAFPLIAGITVGTYSSIFIASPIWANIMESQRIKRNRAHLAKQ